MECRPSAFQLSMQLLQMILVRVFSDKWEVFADFLSLVLGKLKKSSEDEKKRLRMDVLWIVPPFT